MAILYLNLFFDHRVNINHINNLDNNINHNHYLSDMIKMQDQYLQANIHEQQMISYPNYYANYMNILIMYNIIPTMLKIMYYMNILSFCMKVNLYDTMDLMCRYLKINKISKSHLL